MFTPNVQPSASDLSTESSQLSVSSNGSAKMLPFPQNKVEADLVEEAFNKELAQMPIEEHEKILFDIHGVSRIEEEEDPTFIDDLLRQLDFELGKIAGCKKLAYSRALQLNPSYVHNPTFRAMFLRCTWYQAKEAAELMVQHFEIKLELFEHEEILARDVRLSDLSLNEVATLVEGILQVLPARDAAGRTILWTGTNGSTEKAATMGRAMWYYIMATHKSEEMQKSGTALVYYNYGKYMHHETDYRENLSRIYHVIPLKLTGAHYCSEHDHVMPFAAGVRLLLRPDQQHRFRSHFGARNEVEFALQTFGIPTNHIPVKSDGAISTRWHHRWLRAQQEREQKEAKGLTGATSEAILIVPRRNDVLFGRGRRNHEHPGNLHLVQLCRAQFEAYDATSRTGKTEIAKGLVASVHQSEGRFLKWKGEGWIEVDDVDARDKVSHFFRRLRIPLQGMNPAGPRSMLTPEGRKEEGNAKKRKRSLDLTTAPLR